MVLAASCWVAGGELTHAQNATADCEKADDHAVDDCYGPTGEEAEEHGGGDAAPAVADIEASRENLESLERARRCVTPEDGCRGLLADGSIRLLKWF